MQILYIAIELMLLMIRPIQPHFCSYTITTTKASSILLYPSVQHLSELTLLFLDPLV